MPVPVRHCCSRFLRAIFPNCRLATLALAGVGLEATLLMQSPHSVLTQWSPVPGLAVAWLLWFWLSMTWMLRLSHTGLEAIHRQSPWLGRLLSILAGLIFTLLLAVQVASWGLFCQTGVFANVEVCRFLLVNPFTSIWRDLTVPERSAFVLLGIGLPAIVATMPRLLRWLAAGQWPETNPITQESVWIASWRTATILLLLPSWLIANDQSEIRQAAWIDAAKTRVHPVTSLALSAAELFVSEPIEACLDESTLTPLDVTWTPPQNGRRPSVIVLAVESLRADTIQLVHQGQEVLPNINRLTQSGVHFTRAYAQSTHSDYADVCIVSSLYPLRTRRHHYYDVRDPWPKTLAFDVFKQAGYDTAIISSQNESWGQMDQFLQSPNLDLFFDSQRSGLATADVTRDPGLARELKLGALTAGRLEDSQTMDRALGWVTERIERDQPFFLSMNFQSSHFPYELPQDAPRPFQPCELAPQVSFLQYPESEVPTVKNAYFNGIHHCDQQIGRLINRLEEINALDDVVLIVLGENGEAFRENGSCGHAREPVEPVVHVATVIHAPSLLKPGVEDYPLEHVDLLPTLLGRFGWLQHPNFQGCDIYAEDRVPEEERLLYFHANSALAQADAVLLAGRWKYHIDYRRGWTALFDLADDPAESSDVSSEYPELAQRLHRQLRTWRQNQLAYYHYPHYYGRYFPPRSPQWAADGL